MQYKRMHRKKESGEERYGKEKGGGKFKCLFQMRKGIAKEYANK